MNNLYYDCAFTKRLCVHHRNSCISVCIAAVFTVAKILNEHTHRHEAHTHNLQNVKLEVTIS